MNKAVMISIRPEWCQKILNGEKTIEIRKNKPKLELPFKCYIYCTGGSTLYKASRGSCLAANHEYEGLKKWYTIFNQRIIGEFTCNRIFPIVVHDNGSVRDWNHFHLENSCVPYENVAGYIGNGKTGRGWCISELNIYEKPMDLSQFENGSSVLTFRGDTVLGWTGMQRPPQSWCYVDYRGEES